MSSDNPTGADNQQETATAGSSETVRRALFAKSDETVRPLWRHREAGRNDRPATRSSGGNSVPKVGSPLAGRGRCPSQR